MRNFLSFILRCFLLYGVSQVLGTEETNLLNPGKTGSTGMDSYIGSRENVYRGNVTFSRVGSLASPVFYIDAGVRLDLRKIQKWAENVSGTWDREVEALKHRMGWAYGDGTDWLDMNHKGQWFNIEDVWTSLAVRDMEEEVTSDRMEFNRANQRFKELLELAKRAMVHMMGLDPNEDRDKRAPGYVDGLLAVVGGVLGLGSTLYIDDRIHDLTEKLEVNQQLIGNMSAEIKEIGRSLEQVVEAFTRDNEVRKTTRGCQRAYRSGTHYLNRITDSIQQVMQNELPPAIMVPEELIKLMKEIRSMEKTSGVKALIKSEAELLRVPFSWILTEDHLKIVLHVPTVQDEKRMVRDLYFVQSAVLQNGTRLVHFTAPDPFIAVSTDQDLHTVHSAAELKQCHQRDRMYYCSTGGVLSKSADTCTAALFFQETSMAAARCDMELVTATRKVVRTGVNSYRVKGRQKLNRDCGTNGTSRVDTTGEADLITPEGCIDSGPHYSLVGIPRDLETKEVAHEINLPEAVVFRKTFKGQERQDMLDRLDGLDLALAQVNLQPGGNGYLIASIVIGSLLLFLGFVIIVVTCYLQCLQRYRRKNGGDSESMGRPVGEPWWKDHQVYTLKTEGEPDQSLEVVIPTGTLLKDRPDYGGSSSLPDRKRQRYDDEGGPEGEAPIV